MILIIDNYDSFTYNVAQLVQSLGYNVHVVRNDAITIEQIKKLEPSHIIISPGPGGPKDAGISCDVVKSFAGEIPILGVCLGHQCIVEVFGGKIVRAKNIVHGKTSKITHDNKGLFRGVPQNVDVVRYHSLCADFSNVPACLDVTAVSDNTIMGVRHKEFHLCGIQFHPESICTQYGVKMIDNFFKFKISEPQKYRIINRISQGKDLGAKDSYSVMDEIMSGEMTDSEIGMFLGALAVKGVSPVELTAFVNVMRDKSVSSRRIPGLLDTCGTGGDGKYTFNISTAAALLCGYAGIKVAKNGNRSVSSKSGSYDFLSALGIKVDGDMPSNRTDILEKNFAFFFAPLYHSAMKFVAKVRQEIKQRTVFNMLGPLANPMDLDYQVVGVYSQDIMEVYIRVLKQLGRKRAMVVCGYDGMDEISVCDKTMVKELTDKGAILDYSLDPKDFGMKYYDIKYLRGESAAANAVLFMGTIGKNKDTIKNKKARALYDAVCLNAAACIYVSGLTDTIENGYKKAVGLFSDKGFKKYVLSLKDTPTV
ncbi:MAG: anthranilate phosphoribosyltransferase [Candidatus Omnitrophica bacterium]|nr:anthranilate phosphoribosyltransferase [Candidatus Omnitrophota bacterium]